MAENRNSRWWEFYFVRYFVGTVLGAVIVYVLTVSPESAISAFLVPGVTSDISYPQILLLGAYGLAYGYIASGPILVLHATRSVFAYTEESQVLSWLGTFLLLGIIVSAVVIFTKAVGTMHVIAMLLVYAVFVFQVIPLLLVLLSRSEVISRYYLNLTSERSKERDNPSLQEYVESYRHLREHGNAFFIVALEIVLAICLWNLPKDAIQTFAIIVVAVWVLPGSMVWFLGTALENKMVSRSGE